MNILSESDSTVAYIQARFHSMFQWSDNSDQNWTANSTRLELWQNAIRVIFTGTNWLHGIGSAATGARAIEYGGFVTESGVLRRAVEFGIPISILYYGFVFALIRRGYWCAKKNNSPHIGLMVGLIACIMVEDTILQVTEEISITLFFWLFISFLLNGGSSFVKYRTRQIVKFN